MNTVELTSLNAEIEHSVTSTWRDWLGIIASIGCAIHCAAMPFVIAYLPALGLSFLADESFHKWMALVCFLIAIVAFIPGIRKHGNWLPISIGAFGLAFITYAAFGLAGECCPSCEAAAASNNNQMVANDGSGSGTAVACESCEECCEACAAESQDESGAKISGIKNSSESKTMMSVLAPWITPFGGLLLIAAHLLNRRMGYLCSCCTADPEATV